MTDKVKILFLASNPKNSNKLRLDDEIREIHARVQAAEFRDSFELVSRWAVRPLDLLQSLNEVRPHVVHFSGHGSRHAELVLEDDHGTAKPVSEAALLRLFKTARDNIRLVVLNACHSEAQAIAISQQIECTVGMSIEIGDAAAITFASMFYGALAFGRSVGQAFEQGSTALLLQGIPEENTPVLLTQPGVDAFSVSFVVRMAMNPVLPPLAIEILDIAVRNNAPVNLVHHDGGVGVIAGPKQFHCRGDLEEAARLEHSVTVLVQVGWLEPRGKELHYVTQAGYEAARRLQAVQESALTDEAKFIVREAAAGDGIVMMLSSFEGTHIQVNRKSLGDPGDPRQEAASRAAVLGLAKHGHLEPCGTSGDIFRLSASGYKLADGLAADTGT